MVSNVAFSQFLDDDGRLRRAELRAFYEAHLFEVLLPFWLKNGIDEEYGGYFVAFTNRGDRRVSEDKFTWSIGRVVWMFSHLAELDSERVSSEDRSKYLELARLGADFLMEHCMLPNGNCAFLMDRQGNVKEPSPGSGYDTSFYADCFVADGLARFAAAAPERTDALDFALKVYDSIRARYLRYDLRTEPYPIPEGYRGHAVEMIQLKVAQELATTLEKREHPRAAELRDYATGFMRETLDHFVQAEGYVLEFIGADKTPRDTPIGRYVEPGHAIEDAWFIIHHARRIGDPVAIARAVRIVEASLRIGWDDELGGLLRYLDRDGGRPHTPSADDRSPMAEKLRNEWDVKLWWSHSEALYSTLLTHILTERAELLDWYGRVHDYTFATFPNPDREIGEWIQIRDRRGEPANVQVALPVKDPFHAIRNFLLAIELLGDGGEE